ncbi:MAG: hypothetical protein ACRCYD_00865 [Plesiomonas sp.]
MTVRKIDPLTGDIVTSGEQFITGQEEIAQTIQTRLRLYLGEYFRDITDGTPWFETILGKDTNRNAAEASLRNRIVRTEGVIRLTSFSFTADPVSRKASVTAGCMTKYGQIEVVYNG